MSTKNVNQSGKFACTLCPLTYQSKRALTSHGSKKHPEPEKVKLVHDLINLDTRELEALLEDEEEYMDAVETLEEQEGIVNYELESLDGSLINFWEDNRFKSDFARTLEMENFGAVEEQLKDAQTRRKLTAAEKTIACLRSELNEYKKKLVASEKRNEISKADCKVCEDEAKSKAEKARADKAKADKAKADKAKANKAKAEAESVKCEVCPQRFENDLDMNFHLIHVHESKCRDCGKRFYQEALLRTHMKTKHGRESERIVDDIFYHCKNECGEKFRSSKEMKYHSDSCTFKDTREGCTRCEYLAVNSDDLKAHIIRSHPGALQSKRPCRFWKEGKCTKGEDCRFSHRGPQSAGPTSAPLGRSEGRSRCRNGAGCRFLARGSCNFSHTGEEQSQGKPDHQRRAHPQGVQQESRKCWYPNDCRRQRCSFVHDTSADFGNQRKAAVPNVWNNNMKYKY